MSSDGGAKGASGPVGPEGLEDFLAWLQVENTETYKNFLELDEYSQAVLAGLRRGPDCIHSLDVFMSVYEHKHWQGYLAGS